MTDETKIYSEHLLKIPLSLHRGFSSNNDYLVKLFHQGLAVQLDHFTKGLY